MPLSKIQTTNNQVVPNLGRRNIIINGAMQLDQRQGGALTAGVNNTYFLDRWKFYLNGSCAASTQKLPATDSNVSSLHTASGQTFSNVMSIDCTTAATLGSTDLLGVLQLIEGANSVPLAGRSCTLSFYVKTNVTGQYYVTFKIGSGRSYIAPYTVSSANTWEKKTITLTMDTLANLNTSGSITTSAGFQVYFGLRLGTSGQMSNTLNAWHAGNYYGKSDQVTWGTNTADTFYMSGVQLEIGDTATDFEHRPIGEELALCSRYYHTSFSGETTIGGSHPANYSGKVFSWCDHYGSSPDRVAFNYQWPVQMRDIPTVTMYGNGWTSARMSKYNAGSAEYTIDYASGVSRNGLGGYYDVAGVNGDFVVAYVEASAEL